MLEEYLKIYLRQRPLFLGLIRAKELELFQSFQRIILEEDDPPMERVLDFGCGDGFFMRTLMKVAGKRMRADIVGLEVDKKKAEEARKNGAYHKVIVYDGKKIPFPDNHFEAVISNCVLEHVGDNQGTYNIEQGAPKPVLAQTLKEINRVLKPSGKFYCTVMTKRWEEYLFGNLLLGNFYQKWMQKIQKHFNLLTANQWQKGFSKAQFKVEKMIGYLDKQACRWLDVLHYVSLGSLLSYKLTRLFGGQAGRWVLFPWQYDLLPVAKWLAGLIKDDVPVEKAAALFFELEKITDKRPPPRYFPYERVTLAKLK